MFFNESTSHQVLSVQIKCLLQLLAGPRLRPMAGQIETLWCINLWNDKCFLVDISGSGHWQESAGAMAGPLCQTVNKRLFGQGFYWISWHASKHGTTECYSWWLESWGKQCNVEDIYYKYLIFLLSVNMGLNVFQWKANLMKFLRGQKKGKL